MMNQAEKDDAVPFFNPGAEPIQEDESWNTFDKKVKNVVKKFDELKIKLRRPIKVRQHLDDGYNLPVDDKGCALILSNKVKRRGSKKDMENLDKLLTLLGYKVWKYELFYSDESEKVDLRLTTILSNFQSQITDDVKSIVVFVGSHGTSGSFETSDGKLVDLLTELVYKFSHRSCPQLKGKPKIFLAQFCQDFNASKDELEKLIAKFSDFFTEKVVAVKENDPAYINDAIICHSAIPGFESVRYSKTGSVFVHCFCKVVMENAHKLDLTSMMYPVGEEMQKFYRHKGYKITPTATPFHVKKIYFNLAPNPNIIPEKLDVYIKRKIKVENLISAKILEQKCRDIFVFQLQKLNRVKLSNLVKTDITALSSDCKHFIPARFIVLEEQHHFYKICENVTAHQPIHLLQEMEENGREWKWVMSHGDVHEIQKCYRKSRSFLNEAKFMSNIYSSNLTQPVCIVGRPGMGKSSLLAEIGRKLTIRYPERLVLFLKIKDFTDKVKNMEPAGSTLQIKIQTTLQKLLRENHVDDEEFNQIICNALSNDVQFELLLDGFDESEDSYLAHEILQLIKRAYSSVRIWITSRPHVQQELEKALEVPAYELAPFTKEDQVNYLSSFWFFSKNKRLSSEEEEKIKELDKLKYFADFLLKSLKSRMNISKFSNDLADTPLQCMLIGSIYQEEANEFLQSNKVPADHLRISSIGNLFQSYISKSMEKCGNANGEEMHARLALEMCFGFERIQRINLPLTPVEMTDIIKMGIVESVDKTNTNSSPQFTHATLKEYFLAWLPLQLLRISRDDPILSEFLETYLLKFVLKSHICDSKFSTRDGLQKIYTFTFPNMAYFFDFLLPNFAISPIQLQNEECSPKVLNGMLISSINSNYVNIFNFLNSLRQVRESGNEIFTNKLLHSAAAKCNLEFFKLVLTKFEEFHKIDLQTKETLLILATENGNYEVLEYLLNVRKMRFIVERMENKHIRLMLHSLVTETQDKSESEISQRIEILQKLVSINTSLLEQVKDFDRETPLLSPGVHIEILQEIIRLGANVLAQDSEKCNILHLNYHRQHLTSEDFHTLVMSIPEDKLNELVLLKDSDDPYSNRIAMEYLMIFSKEVLGIVEPLIHSRLGNFGETPLMKLITRIDPLPETLEKFYNSGAAFNCSDELKYSVLVQAISNERSGDTIIKLIELGADANWRGWHGESLLHVGAYWRNMEAIKMLLDNQFMNVNDKDAYGRTPLDYTVESRNGKGNGESGSLLKTGMELYKRGGKIKHGSAGMRSRLHLAVEDSNFNLEFVKLLLGLGLNVNEQDELGNTPTHWLALDWIKNPWKCLGFSKILREFIQNENIDMTIQNNEGKTPFQLAFKIKQMDFETFEMFRSKAEVEWTNQVATLGVKFLVSTSVSEAECLSGLKELEEHQPNFSFVDEEGNSLLHLCVENIMRRDWKHFERKEMERAGTEYEKFPLFCRSWISDLNLMKYLIKNGANVYQKNEMDLTFLHAFIGKGPSLTDFEIIRKYLDKKDCLDLFNIPGGADQATPFHMAISKVSMGEEILRHLQAKGVDFNVVDKNGNSVLFYAAKSFAAKQLLPHLINLGANWKHRNSRKESLLHVLAKTRTTSEEPLKYFLEKDGLDVNEKNVDGNTPLDCEIIDGASSMCDKIRLLVEYGADITIKNNEGHTPVQLATNLRKNYIVEFLVQIPK